MGKILVVDDVQAVAPLRTPLRELGHTIVTASDAYTGLGVAMRERPVLIMIALNLPGGGGLMMLERLRNNSGTAETPVIILFEAYDSVGEPPKDDLVRMIQKPVEAQALKPLILELLSLAPPPPAAAAEPASAPDASAPSTAAAAPPAPASDFEKEPSTDGGALGGDILDLDL